MGWRIGFKAVFLCCAAGIVLHCGHALAGPVGPPLPTPSEVLAVDDATVSSSPKATPGLPTSNHAIENAGERRALGVAKKPSAKDNVGPTKEATAAQAGAASQVITMVGALTLVVALILAAASVLKRLAKQGGSLSGGFGAGGRSPAGLLSVLGRYPIAGGQTLVLLKVDRRVLLLSQTRSGRFGSAVTLSTLCEITEAEDVASILTKATDEEGRSLAKTFERVLRASEKGTDRALARAAAPAPVVNVRPTGEAQRAAAANERATTLRSATVAAAGVSRPVRPAATGAVSGAESVEVIRRRLNAMRSEQVRMPRATAGVRA